MQQLLQQLVNGLSYGAIYALIAVGYTMVYGVLRLINFAHGEVYMVGAMVGLYSFTQLNFTASPSFAAAPWAFAIVALALLLYLAIPLLLHHRKPSRAGWIALALPGAVLLLTPFLRWHPVAREPHWYSLPLVLIAAITVCGLLGFTIERVAYRPLRNQPRINSLITAIGISMFLQYGGQWLFGPSPQSFPQLIPGLEGHEALCTIHGVVIGKVDAMIFLFTLALMAALWFIVMRTRAGMALRAVSFRFDVASLMGIDVNRIVSFTFVLGSSLAAVAGILVGLRSPQVQPLMGFQPGLKAFIAAVLGGIGNIPGAVLGGLILGLTEALVVNYFPHGSQYRDGVAFVVLIVILLVKPSGLLGRNTIEKV